MPVPSEDFELHPLPLLWWEHKTTKLVYILTGLFGFFLSRLDKIQKLQTIHLIVLYDAASKLVELDKIPLEWEFETGPCCTGV
jgi:hypothetical protein